MPDPKPIPSFPLLLQRFFVEHLGNQRAVSPRTIAAYRDTFRLLLSFAEAKIGKAPTRLALADLDAQLILSFLDHLEKVRSNGARSRNARNFDQEPRRLALVDHRFETRIVLDQHRVTSSLGRKRRGAHGPERAGARREREAG